MIRQKLFFKELIFRERGINCSQKFCRESNYCFSIRFPFGSLFEVILPEIRALSFNPACHNKGNSSGICITPFRDSEFGLMLTGLFNYLVQVTKPNKFSFISKSFYVNYPSHKVNWGIRVNFRDSGKYFYFFKAVLSYFFIS